MGDKTFIDFTLEWVTNNKRNVCKNLSHTGVNPDNYSDQLGFTPYEIKDLSKWSSDAYMS